MDEVEEVYASLIGRLDGAEAEPCPTLRSDWNQRPDDPERRESSVSSQCRKKVQSMGAERLESLSTWKHQV
jgi:hypothetical protein